MSKSLVFSSKLLPFEAGHVITFQGKTNESAEYFDFFLGSDNGTTDDFGDIQFHVAVTFTGEPRIVRNFYTKGKGWEEVQEIEHNLMPGAQANPMKRGEDFKISVHAATNRFFMSVNDKPYCTFPYRKRLSDVRRFNVYGDIEKLYQVEHSVVQRLTPEQKSIFSGSLPILNAETVLVFCGALSESESGKFNVTLKDSQTEKILLKTKVDLEVKEVSAVSSEMLKVDSTKTFPLTINEDEFAIGITKHDFVVTANGEHLLKHPFEDKNFLARPMKFEVTTSNDLNLEIKGVDSYVMGEVIEAVAELPVVEIEAKSEIVESKKSRKRLTDKILSKIFSH